jgi:hypothetical protein
VRTGRARTTIRETVKKSGSTERLVVFYSRVKFPP